MRKTVHLKDSWDFSKDQTQWETVSLPHTWNNIDGQDGGNDYLREKCWYVKELDVPEMKPDCEIWLEITGAASICEVFLGDRKLCTHEGGYSTFRCNLTSAWKAGETKLTLCVDNRENDYVYPQKADFTFYGGLYREVNIIVVPQQHFALSYAGGSGIKVTPCVNLADCSAEVTLEAWLEGAPDCVQFTLGEKTQTAPVLNGHATSVFHMENVHLWNGIADPYLYLASATLASGDTVSVRFGCRTFEMNPQKGFLLNGKEYPLRGVSRHQDRESLGNALSLHEHTEDMELIREIGANTIRLAHYQHAQEFYDLCDEYGMIVWAEIPYITEHMPNGRENTLSQMRELIVQCYNHPSIVCWGLSNEISVHGVTSDVIENHKVLNALCHQLDATRPTTMAHAFMLEQDSPLTKISDIGGYNLYYGWYMGTLEQNDSFFDEYHAQFPDRVIAFSEYGADCNPQFQTATPQQGDYSEQYQCLYHEYILGTIARHPWLWATHCWNMFDFAADGREEGGKKGVNQKGLVTMNRKVKKDSFYLYKAAWNHSDPFVHLCGNRYIDRPESKTEIKVYSNLHEVSLYQDGELLETQQGETIFVFQARINGEHTFVAKSGDKTDTMQIRKVEKANPDYAFGQSGAVANWFDEESFQSDCFSIRDSFGALSSHPEAGKIVNVLMQKMVASRGDVAKSANQNANLQKMLAGMSFQSLLKQAGDSIPPEAIKQLNNQLQRIKK